VEGGKAGGIAGAAGRRVWSVACRVEMGACSCFCVEACII
jgi:hypothetical protein